MASTDWTEATGNLSAGTIDRGVTSGIAPPNGGGSFIYGFNSLANTPGAAALYAAQANFAPLAKGARISGALQRGISGGPLNFSPFLFCGLQGPSVDDDCYMLGLSDDDPHRIVLAKGPLSGGIPGGPVSTATGVLARSNATFTPGTWLHIQLDMIVNLNGDVLLKATQNNLGANAVTAPSFVAIPGIATIVDDALGINTATQPFVSGYAGFGFTSKDVTRRGFFDHIVLARQL